MVGIWATNPSLGDIIGTQLYAWASKDSISDWGYAFIILGLLIFAIAILNLCCLQEYPVSLGIIINEKANILDPSKSDFDKTRS